MSAYVVVAGDAGITEVINAAVKVGGPVTAIVVGSADLAQQVAAPGVDRVVWLGDPGDKPIEAYAPAVGALVVAAPAPVLSGRKPAERVLLGGAAAALQAPVVSSPMDVRSDNGQTVVEHGVFGGIALRTTAYDGPVAIVLDGGAAVNGGGSAAVEQAAASATTSMTVTSLQPNTATAADLGSASLVVGVGRGLKAQADLPIVEALATAMGAELGCSRPVAEGLEWLPRDRYVGISGQQIAPEVYVMVGISGALQHMGGCRGAQLIVSINTDKDAPVVSQSDYVLTGDLYSLVPAITAALS
ncbi:MAG: electron transfer flavoprotein subunit alpha/FixB family protein [Propionibacteriaceae bacterium]|jgi:electron transfer flavoprotein alpha subunit|nr:electron transfer flavoprotein subunit alpha/FixB family protein [Propionibacteriaceae bacterium]